MDDQLEPLTILYCGANPIVKTSNHIDLGKECQSIRDAIDGGPFRLYPEYATNDELLVRLLRQEQPTVVHFGLHGLRTGAGTEGPLRDLAGEVGSEGGLVLIERNGAPVVLGPAKLRRILKVSGKAPRCVVMSACHSEAFGELLAEDVDHVVAMKSAISDASAIVFSRGLYRYLSQGMTISEAVQSAAVVLNAPEHDYPVVCRRPGVADERLVQPPPPPPYQPRWWLARVSPLVLVVVAMLMLVSGQAALASDVRLWLMSMRRNVAPLHESDRLRVVLVDPQSEASLKGTWFTARGGGYLGLYGEKWRFAYAWAVERLTDAGAAVIALDVPFENEPKDEREEAATERLAWAIERAGNRGTRVVLTAFDRNRQSGSPRIAKQLVQAVSASHPDARCAIAQPCIGRPADGPNVPILPLVLEASPPNFSLGLCAYALAQGTLPSWSKDERKLSFARDRASTVAFTGPEPLSDIEACPMASEGGRAVQRLLAPFASELSRSNRRVIPMEKLVGDAAEAVDVAHKIVLIGQQGMVPDVVLGDVAPQGGALWGVSAHAAAIDALLSEDGLMTVLSPGYQLTWAAVLAWLAILSLIRLRTRPAWLRGGLMVAFVAVDFAIAGVAARAGLITDPQEHLVVVPLAYVVATLMQADLRTVFFRRRRLQVRADRISP